MPAITSKRIYFSMALVACSVLMLEIAITRIFSLLAHHHFTHLIVSVTMLGSGAAASWLAFRQRTQKDRIDPEYLSTTAFLYAFAVPISIGLIVLIQPETGRMKTASDISWLVLTILATTLPFFFAGLFIASVITAYQADVHRIYFADLAGASFGCLSAVLTIQTIGATNTVFVAAVMAGTAASLVAPQASRRSWIRVALLSALLVAGVVFDPYFVHTPKSKFLSWYVPQEAARKLIEYSKWDMVARVDITNSTKAWIPACGGNLSKAAHKMTWPRRLVCQDGGAPTWIFECSGTVEDMAFLNEYLQAAPYVLRPSPKVLVIGVGGGVDVLVALKHGAREITGVDINPKMVKAIKEDFNEYTGGIFHKPPVNILVSEGRHFLSRDESQYDIIQLSGVDTLTALSSGAYAMAENYLYTVEAIHDFMDRLSSDGVLSFSRWYFKPPRESLRLAATMVEAIDLRQAAEPWKHLVIVAGESWADTLMRKRPFTEAEVETLRQWAAAHDFHMMYDPFKDQGNYFDKAIRPKRAEREAFHDSYLYRIDPSTDDSPFFFNYHKLGTTTYKERAKGSDFPMALVTLLWSLGTVFVLGIAGILLPLAGHRLSPQPGKWKALIYFGALGLGFIFVEIALIQRLMVLLGGPAYSLAITLFAVLLFAGIGSRLSSQWSQNPAQAIRLLAVAIPVAILLLAWACDFVVPYAQGLNWYLRVVVSMLLIGPTALLLGMPFPTGATVLSRYAPDWVPWAWAINSFLTVLGPLLCVGLSMHIGFKMCFAIAAGIYLVGFGIFYSLARNSGNEYVAPAPETT